MLRPPFITILTASLNSGATIRKTVESIKNQSFQDLEHIVIDGGSHDETLMILKQNEKAYNLTWISELDCGISDALNKGLNLARGKYIHVLHADDHLLSSDSLKKVYGLIKKEQYDIFCSPVYKKHHLYGNRLLKPIRLLWWHHFKTIFLHQGSFVHRRVYDLIGGYRPNFSIAMDYDFFYRALMSRSIVKFGHQPIAVMGSKGISSNQDFILQRLQEEALVQRLNETNPFWRFAQLLFRTFYFPFKLRLLPKIKISR